MAMAASRRHHAAMLFNFELKPLNEGRRPWRRTGIRSGGPCRRAALVRQTPDGSSNSPAGFQSMYSSTFIFAKKQFDDAFHRLDQEIADMAKSIPGYLGEEAWENQTTGLVCNVYYWQSLEALQQLIRHPRHLDAKREQGTWLAGYQVIISQVIRTYGDSKLSHLLPVIAAG
jgi:heme-degrading monooxygenase HmoA